MSENQDFEYQAVSDALESAAVATPAADCHGLLCGLICAAGFADQKLWVAELFEAPFLRQPNIWPLDKIPGREAFVMLHETETDRGAWPGDVVLVLDWPSTWNSP